MALGSEVQPAARKPAFPSHFFPSLPHAHNYLSLSFRRYRGAGWPGVHSTGSLSGGLCVVLQRLTSTALGRPKHHFRLVREEQRSHRLVGDWSWD